MQKLDKRVYNLQSDIMSDFEYIGEFQPENSPTDQSPDQRNKESFEKDVKMKDMEYNFDR